MNIGFGSHRTAGDVTKEFIEMPQFVPEGVFFVFRDGHPVGSAFAWRDSANEWKHGRLEMVCVIPSHRGHNLGYFLTLKVLHWFKDNGFADVELTTDDWRLAAVKQYLRLGFQPVINDEYTRRRWLQVIEKLEHSAAGASPSRVG
jgi:mycothiol synthase